MFNEGVDLPDVDTILMLRPTESRILWLQQFGRGLRYRPGKTLRVVDYIGNHRVFLNKTRALLNLGDANRDVAYALDQYETGTLELPPGCSVTYDLRAIEILRALVQPTGVGEALENFYRDFRDRLGRRPLALEVLSEGWNPGSARQHHGSWLDFVRAMGDFSPEQERAWQTYAPFLRALEVTPMTRSYKMVLLLAMLGEDALPGSIGMDRLTERFAEQARRYATVRNETASLEDAAELRRMLERNPVAAWTDGKGTGGVAYFTYDGGRFATSPSLDVPDDDPAGGAGPGLGDRGLAAGDVPAAAWRRAAGGQDRLQRQPFGRAAHPVSSRPRAARGDPGGLGRCRRQRRDAAGEVREGRDQRGDAAGRVGGERAARDSARVVRREGGTAGAGGARGVRASRQMST